VDLTLGPAFCDAIEECRAQSALDSEYVRNGTLMDECPFTWRRTDVVVTYQNDMDARWTEDWPTLEHANEGWRTAVTSMNAASMVGVTLELLYWLPRFGDYARLAWALSRVDWSAPADADHIYRAAVRHAMLQDQLDLLWAWSSAKARYLRRAG
jgi:hypothetical protein